VSDDIRCEFTDSPAASDLDAVDAGLHLFNLAAADLDAVRTLGCFARGAEGEVVGGLRARIWGTAVEVQQLWVDESRRRQGVGARLMRLLEDGVRRRGATLIYLDTFTFQAPGFYERCGFSVAARLDGMPGGIAKYLMVKRLGAEGG
jgi:GNAT superfamily N-acetyltransferase